MKTLIGLCCLIFLNGPLFAQSVAELDIKNGFRDIPLGAPKGSLNIQSSSPVKPDGTQTVYLKRSDMTFNGLPLFMISCELSNDRVYEIDVFGSVAVQQGQKFTGYVDYLRDLFGNPTASRVQADGMKVSVWEGQQVRLEAWEKYLKTPAGFGYQITMKVISRPGVEAMKVNRIKTIKDGF